MSCLFSTPRTSTMKKLRSPSWKASSGRTARSAHTAAQWIASIPSRVCAQSRARSTRKASIRHGLKKCGHCRQQFTARVGTVFESSHIPLHKWFQAIHLLCSSKKGISTPPTAPHLGDHLQDGLVHEPQHTRGDAHGRAAPRMGGAGTDRRGRRDLHRPQEGVCRKRPGGAHKMAVLTLVERGGEARQLPHRQYERWRTFSPSCAENVDRESRRSPRTRPGNIVGLKQRVCRPREPSTTRPTSGAVGDIHTNTVEGYFSIFKRGMKGVYQHCSEKHLHRYLAEFDFRYNARSALGVEDEARTEKALRGIKGKRLTYRPADRS